MANEIDKQIVGNAVVEAHRVPEPLVDVVSGDDRGILAAQMQRPRGIAFQCDLRRGVGLVDREHLAGDLVDRYAGRERLLLGDLREAQQQSGDLLRAHVAAPLAWYPAAWPAKPTCVASRRSEEHTSELQSRLHLVCRLLLEKK